MKYLLFIILLTLPLHAQGLFEDAESGNATEDLSYNMNGYIRGSYFGGKVFEDEKYETKSNYGEVSSKINVKKGDIGDAFAELRYRNGYEFGKEVGELTVREAYVNVFSGYLDFRVGKQIVVWGRADGFNPTNNITPQNMLARSVDEDDKRLGNFLIKSNIKLQPIRIEAIWVPVYQSSVLPLDMAALPDNVTIINPVFPDAELGNSAFALKANLELPSFDGSLSYFEGYNPFPGVDIESVDMSGQIPLISVIPKAYRMRVAGADFSTTAFDLGLRGEIGYRSPIEDFTDNVHITNPDIQYVFGIDKDFGDWNFITQYIGRYVMDFENLVKPINQLDMPNYIIEEKNRMFSQQLYELSHAVSMRAALNLFYETMTIELLSMANFTTEEFLIKPKITYKIADALTLVGGVEYYGGPDETLFGLVGDHLSSVFIELKTSF
ncbi:DUF1302 family protein [Bacteroidota bacterium]